MVLQPLAAAAPSGAELFRLGHLMDEGNPLKELNGGLREIENATPEPIRRAEGSPPRPRLRRRARRLPRSRRRIRRHRLLALEDPAEEEMMAAMMMRTGSRKMSSGDGEPRRSPASRHGEMVLAAEMKVKRPAQPPERRRSSRI